MARANRPNINVVDANYLIDIAGIRRATADVIVEHLAQHGPIREFEDLLEVRGVGPATVKKIQREFIAEPDTAAREPEPKRAHNATGPNGVIDITVRGAYSQWAIGSRTAEALRSARSPIDLASAQMAFVIASAMNAYSTLYGQPNRY